MDNHDEESIANKLGKECFEDQSDVEIVLMGRTLFNAVIFKTKHWAWLIKFKNSLQYKYATVEFTDSGVLLGLYEHDLEISLYQICTTICGYDNKIENTQEFQTNKKWGEILRKLVQMRLKYTAKSYDLLSNNCRDFARELGAFMSPSFVSSVYNQSGDAYFPSKVSFLSHMCLVSHDLKN